MWISRWVYVCWFICENFIIRDLACIIPLRLVPSSCRHLFRKKVCLVVVIVFRCLLLILRVWSMESGKSVGIHVEEESTSRATMVGRIPMETMTEVWEDPLEEIAESNWPAKGGYAWVAADVRNQSSLFRWSRLLNSWLNCTPIIAKGVNRGIVSLERVSAIDRVCHG